jgi:Ribonuclease G/E
MLTICDSCKAEFEPNMRTSREGEVETTCFTCPSCQAEYIVYKTNPELRKMQQKIENMRNRITKQRNNGYVKPEKLKEYQSLTAEFKEKMDIYNGKESTDQQG